jgi:hypothetical protein
MSSHGNRLYSSFPQSAFYLWPKYLVVITQKKKHFRSTDNAMMSSGKHDDDDHPSAGSMRFQSDKRQFGGFLMLLGFCAMIQPLYNIAIAIGTDSSTVRHHTPFGVLFGGLWLFTSGIFTVFLGYHETAYGWGQRKILTSSLILFTQVS